MKSKSRFLVYCKMTCLGGSEQGECPCRSPATCELQDDPAYEQARAEAKIRMLRYLKNGLNR